MNDIPNTFNPLDMLHKLSELRENIDLKLTSTVTTDKAHETETIDNNEEFLFEEIEAILMHLDDVRNDILYLESPYLTEGTLQGSSVNRKISVNGRLIKEDQPLEIQMDGETNWLKTWIAHDGSTYYFTCFGRKVNALNVKCTIRLREVHQN